MAKYSIQNVHDNYMNYLYDELLRERNLVKTFYHNSNYLGRVYLYCIDKLIQGCAASFHLIKIERDKAIVNSQTSNTLTD